MHNGEVSVLKYALSSELLDRFKEGSLVLVAQMVETLRYKPEGRGFDSQWCNLNFSLK
jgi:hypothetical protein